MSRVLPRPVDEIANLFKQTVKWLDERGWSLSDADWVELNVRILQMTGGFTSGRFEHFLALVDEYRLYKIPEYIQDIMKLVLFELRRIFRVKSLRALEKLIVRDVRDITEVARHLRPPRPSPGSSGREPG